MHLWFELKTTTTMNTPNLNKIHPVNSKNILVPEKLLTDVLL